MYRLKMSLEEIKNNINLRVDYWKYIYGTNCYAFALGLDIYEDYIYKNAYDGGVIYKNMIDNDIDLGKLSFLEAVLLDLDALGYQYAEVGPKEKIPENYWKIAYYENDMYADFHFLRQAKNGIWYHKQGRSNIPTAKDDGGYIITDPREVQYDCPGYEYQKCFCLTLGNK